MEYTGKFLRSPRSPKSSRDRLNPSRRNFALGDVSPLNVCSALFPRRPRSRPPFESTCRPIQASSISLQPPCNSSSKQRPLHQKPYRHLDTSRYAVPADFYWHPLDWGANGHVALMLDSSLHFVYSVNLALRKSECEVDDTMALKFDESGHGLVVGSSLGTVSLIDFDRDTVTRRINATESVCCCVDVLGSKIVSAHDSGQAVVSDARSDAPAQMIHAHSGCLCATGFDSSGDRLATTSFGCVKVWDVRKPTTPVVRLKGHSSDVRAFSFAPNARNRMVTGGGTSDKHIKIWDLGTGTELLDVNVGCQVCNAFWNGDKNEIVTTEGFNSNTITLWDASELKTVGSISGHTDRVLYSALSHDKNNGVTLTSKDGLQFWKLYPETERRIR